MTAAPPPNWSESAELWDETYRAKGWDYLDGIGEVAHYMVLIGYMSYGAECPSVVDLGCGHGRLLRLLAKFGFSSYLGVDLSTEAISRARALEIPNCRFRVANLEQWTTRKKFDVVVLNECLYYVQHPVATAVSLRHAMADGGLLLISMWRHATSMQIWQELAVRPELELLNATSVESDGVAWDVKAFHAA